jgi:hypothetical protein
MGLTVTVSGIYAYVQAALLIAASMAYSSYAKAKAQKKASTAAISARQPLTVRGPIEAVKILYGRRRVGGVIVFAGTSGVKNEYLNVVIAFTAHQATLENIMVNEDIVTINSLGQPLYGKYVGKAQFVWHDGQDGQTADTGLIAAMPSQWTSAHKLSGISYLYCWFRYDSDTFPGGALPNITAILTGKTSNVALAINDWLADTTYGMSVPAAEIDSTAFAAAVAACDEAVDLYAGGTEKRYVYSQIHTADQKHEEVLQEMVQACAGRLVYSGGKWILTVGYQTPTVTLTEAHIVGPIKLTTRVAESERANGVRGIFTSEGAKWQETDIPAYQSPIYLAADNNQEYWLDLDLPGTVSSPTAQRIHRIELERLRREITCSLRVDLIGLQIRAGDTVMVTFALYGWVAKTFEVIEWKLGVDEQETPAPVIELQLRETDANVYAWEMAYEQALPAAPATILPDPWTVAVPTSVTLVSSSDGLQNDGTVIPRLKFEWVAPSDQFVQSGGRYQMEYKLHADATWTAWPWQSGDSLVSYITGVKIGGVYDARIKALNILGVSSAWVTVESVTVLGDVTAPAVPSGLTATAATGKAVSLAWADNTEADLDEYLLYRSATNDSATASLIAELRASLFTDASVDYATTYYYWLKAADRSVNVSAFSAVATATTAKIASTDTNQTAPAKPSTPTYSSEGTTTAGDGTVNAHIVLSIAALSSGAVLQNVLCRAHGTTDDWTVMAQLANSTAATVRVDDLQPGKAYDFAAQGVSFSGILGTVSDALERTAPNKTTAPSTPSGLAVSSSRIHVDAKVTCGTDKYSLMGAEITWTAPTDKDIAYVQVEWTSNNSEPLKAMILTDNAGPGSQFVPPDQGWAVIYKTIVGGTGYAQVYFVNRSGVKSARASIALTSAFSKSAGSVAAQDSDSLEVSGIKTGSASASSVVKVLARAPGGESTITLTGGATYEKVNISLSNLGFSTKPDSGTARCISNQNIDAYYDKGDAGSTSTNAVLFVQRFDQTNLPAGNQTFTWTFEEKD